MSGMRALSTQMLGVCVCVTLCTCASVLCVCVCVCVFFWKTGLKMCAHVSEQVSSVSVSVCE